MVRGVLAAQGATGRRSLRGGGLSLPAARTSPITACGILCTQCRTARSYRSLHLALIQRIVVDPRSSIAMSTTTINLRSSHRFALSQSVWFKRQFNDHDDGWLLLNPDGTHLRDRAGKLIGQLQVIGAERAAEQLLPSRIDHRDLFSSNIIDNKFMIWK